MKFYGLLYTDGDGGQHSANASYRSRSHRLRSYLLQSVQLHRSLLSMGHGGLFLATNASSELRRQLEIIGCVGADGPTLVDLPIRLTIPVGIPFYEAHFKIDLFRLLGESVLGSYSVVLDLDVNCRRLCSPALARGESLGYPMIYDITDQVVPAYGQDRIRSDIELVSGHKMGDQPVRWLGGEFVSADPTFFSSLAVQCNQFLPTYLDNLAALHHKGDEMLVSAALNTRLRTVRTEDAGAQAIVARHWTIPTRHRQQPLRRALQAEFLHLPSSKRLLARRATQRSPVVSANDLRLREVLRAGRSWLDRGAGAVSTR